MIEARLEESEIRRLLELPGGGARAFAGVATLEAPADQCVHFVNREVAAETRAAFAARRGCMVIGPPGSAEGEWGDTVVLEAKDPRAAVARVLTFIRETGRQVPLVAARSIASSAVVSALAVIDGDVEVEQDVLVEPFCVIGPGVRIGKGTIIRSGVRIHERVQIGAHNLIGANCVIGHDGFGFVRDSNGDKVLIAHLGGVVLGDHVHLGASTSIQAGMIEPTVVADYAKIGDRVVIGHSSRIGRNASLIAGNSLGGNAILAEEAWLGLNATVRDHVRVGQNALVGMDASIQEDLPDDHAARAPRPDVSPRTDPSRDGIGFPRKRRGPER